MKRNLALTTLSSVLVVSMALSANQAVAEESTIFINGKSCGSFNQVSIDKSGRLTLTGDNLTCLGASDETNPPNPPNPPGPTNPTNPPTDPEVPGSCDAADSKLISKTYSLFEHDWLRALGTDARNPVILQPSEVFTIKINKPNGGLGYGFLNTINAKKSAIRTAVVSACPGSMVPAKSLGWNGIGKNPCSVTGIEDKLALTFYESVPIGAGQCRLDPDTQYYFNVKNMNADGSNSCVGRECDFAFSYNMDVSKRHTK